MASEHRRGRDNRPPVEDVDRLPPQDLEAEQAVLGAVLLGGHGIDAAREVLEARDFYRDSHRMIYGAAMSLAEKGQPVDLTTVSSVLRAADTLDAAGGVGYLERLVGAMPYSVNVTRYATTVQALAVKRRLCWELQSTARLLAGPDPDFASVEEQIAEAEATLRKLAQQARSESPRPAFACDAVACDEAWRAGHARSGTVVKTGFATLDRWLCDGIQRPETHLLVANAGKGKTALAVYLEAQAALQGVRVGHLALELGQANVTARFYAMISAITQDGCNVPQWSLREGLPTSPLWAERIEQISSWSRQSGLLNVIDHEQVERRLYAVQQAIRYLAEERRCGLICVDNFNNITVPGSTGFEAGERVAEMLDDAAKQFKIPVLVCAQRGKHGGAYMSPRLEQDAGVILVLDRKRGEDAAAIHVEKNREGRGEGSIAVIGDRDTLSFREGDAFEDNPDSWRQGQLAAAGPDPVDYDDDDTPWRLAGE